MLQDNPCSKILPHTLSLIIKVQGTNMDTKEDLEVIINPNTPLINNRRGTI
jgi:hypothetical protein